MPRSLSVARAQVSRENEPAYLAALSALAARLQARGQALWLFRHPTRPDTFLEFSESPAPEQHRSRVEPVREEAELEARLRTLAAYAHDAGELWQEVPLESH